VKQEGTHSSKDQTGLFLGLIFVALTVVIGAYILESRKVKSQEKVIAQEVKAEQSRVQVEAAVNRHIQMTNRKIETDQEKVRQDSLFTIPRVGQVVKSEEETSSGVGMTSDRVENNVARDLQARNQARDKITSVGGVIQNEMAEQENYQRQVKLANAAYAKEFIENARRHGYDVQLSDDLKVVNVKERSGAAETNQASGQAYR
jgi:hypothetical protein